MFLDGYSIGQKKNPTIFKVHKKSIVEAIGATTKQSHGLSQGNSKSN